MNVFLTVDVEVWPSRERPHEAEFLDHVQRHIYGRTGNDECGLPFQMALLGEHGLKGVFLVEALFASAMGTEVLQEIVDLIRGAGQEVQLHLHTEWLSAMPNPILPGRPGRHLRDFTEDEQALLIGRAVENLAACGVEDVRAFRAGNYGADRSTLRALRRVGIPFDTSYNLPYLRPGIDLGAEGPLLQPTRIDGVHEFPITHFEDWPGHVRHTQLAACSFRELSSMMLQAWRNGWYSFVIVSHSFELLTTQWDARDTIIVRRLRNLCRFLAGNPDKFRTAGFADLNPTEIPDGLQVPPLKSNPVRTAVRYGEQLMGRLFR
jgi:hypothetical protein